MRPLGKKASEDHDDAGGKVVTYRAKASSCRACELRERCTSNKAGRNLRRGPLEEYVELVRAYRGTEHYEKALRKRAVWVEPLFGEAKEWHGMVRFRLRMLEKVNIEALMVAAGQNTKRLVASHGQGPKPVAQVAALQLPEGPPSCSRDRVRRRRQCVLQGSRRRFSTRWRVCETASIVTPTRLLLSLFTSRLEGGSSRKLTRLWEQEGVRLRLHPAIRVFINAWIAVSKVLP